MDEVIRRKLLIDGEGMGDERRLTMVMKLFRRWTPDGDDTTLRNLTHLLQQSDTAMYKTLMVNEAIERESKQCAVMAEKVQAETSQAQVNFVDWKRRLKAVQQVRRYRLEYQLISDLIRKYPDRAEMKRRLEELRVAMRDGVKRKSQFDAVLDLRRKQVHVLCIALNELERLI